MKSAVKPLLFKPDMEEAVKRWDAYYNGDIIKRPIICVTAPKRGCEEYQRHGGSYYDQVYEDIDLILRHALEDAENTFFGGDLIPAYYPSLGPDEVACYCGAKLEFQEDSMHTNWCVPFVEDWAETEPLHIHEDSPYWQRILQIYRRGAELLKGKMLMYHVDLHTNMDLLAAVRGTENLCMDLIDCPELVDEAMKQSRALFHKLWKDIAEAGQMDENGYWFGAYGQKGMAILQCDFGAVISPEMFERWVMPALEEEADIVDRVIYHWDGPETLRHKKALLNSDKIHTLAYVPLPSEGGHINLLPMLRELQDCGKGVYVSGTPEELKMMHKVLDPTKTIYNTSAKTQSEAEELLEWFEKNT